jgi:hypothetical protein
VARGHRRYSGKRALPPMMGVVPGGSTGTLTNRCLRVKAKGCLVWRYGCAVRLLRSSRAIPTWRPTRATSESSVRGRVAALAASTTVRRSCPTKSLFPPSHHHVMEGGQSIQAGLSRHGRRTPAVLAQFGKVCPSVPYPVRNEDLGLWFLRIHYLAIPRYQVPSLRRTDIPGSGWALEAAHRLRQQHFGKPEDNFREEDREQDRGQEHHVQRQGADERL